MRDHSASYWFTAGQTVQVIDNITKAGQNLRGRVGVVQETWEKCDVDPTCCCAEQVESDLAVRVLFQGTEADADAEGSFLFHFNEEELETVTVEQAQS